MCFMSCVLCLPVVLHTELLDLQEILDEVVRELHKVKDEIINGKQCFLN